MSKRDGNLRSIFKDNLKDFMWIPIETALTSGPGIPDSWYMAPTGVPGWIEHKKPPHKVTIEQGAILSRMVRMGGRAFVALRLEEEELRIYCGSVSPQLAQLTYKAIREKVPYLGAWTGVPARWDWVCIRQILGE
jgi:hypothetical protein